MEIYSFFSGLGVLDLGFEEAGFNISFVNEYNNDFLQAYQYARRNRKQKPQLGYHCCSAADFLNDELWENIFKDKNKNFGIIGGPPCPDFSVAGKNKGFQGNNGQLTSVYFELIIKRKPAFFLFENVKGLYKTKKHRKFYEEYKDKLNKAGYILCDEVLNALEFGVPQYRDRLILVGFNKNIFKNTNEFNMKSHIKYNLQTIFKQSWPQKDPFILDSKRKIPNNIIKELTVEYWFNKNDVNHHLNSSDVFNVKKIERFENVYEGDVSKKSFKRLHRWRYAPTSAYGNNEVHLHPYKLRRITVAEALAIQSLPKWFVLPSGISLSAKFKMTGNSVPFLLAKGVALALHDYIVNNNIE